MTLDRESYFFTPRYTRGQVCKVLGVTKDTLRHYEDCGLVKPKESEKNRYKYYSIADLEILDVILFLRAIDVPIQEIPKFIGCKDIDIYGSFVDEQIKIANSKINYWNHIKNILNYMKNALDDYKDKPNNVNVVENTIFRFRVSKFNHNNGDIQHMSPSGISSMTSSHIIKLKILDKKWILSNREDKSDIILGHICGEDESGEDIHSDIIPLSLMLTTLEKSDKLPDTIIELSEKYDNKYEFDSKIYIIEHTFFNIFNQEALLRHIYLPIIKIKI